PVSALRSALSLPAALPIWGGRRVVPPTLRGGRRHAACHRVRRSAASSCVASCASCVASSPARRRARIGASIVRVFAAWQLAQRRSEEHTSELQSRENLVCR